MAVPLLHGGGTADEVVEAFAAGVPVVSTRKGVEGLAADDGTHLLIAEDAEGFVEAVSALWRDPPLAARLAVNARALVAERYSWETAAGRVAQALAALGAAA